MMCAAVLHVPQCVLPTPSLPRYRCCRRVVAATVDGEQLSDEVAALELEDCPIRMAAHPSGRALVLALGGGGLCRVNVARPDGSGGAPTLSLVTSSGFLALVYVYREGTVPRERRAPRRRRRHPVAVPRQR